MEQEKDLSIDTLSEGAAVERVNLALREVFTNIQDPNTDWKKARTVTMKLTIKSNENRDIGDVVVEVDKKIAPIKPFGTMIFMGIGKDGKGRASEHVSNQPSLPGTEKALPGVDNVYKLEKKEVAQ